MSPSSSQNQDPFVQRMASKAKLRERALERLEEEELERLRNFFSRWPPPPFSIGITIEMKLEAIMEQPLTEYEVQDSAQGTGGTLEPSQLYHAEAKREEVRLQTNYGRHEIFQRKAGFRRCGVFVRHNVKCLWEKLGIWNPAWGMGGRNVQPNDYVGDWAWRWDSGLAGLSRMSYTEQFFARTLRQRQNLPRGEKAPIVPQSRLDQDATASQFESFIMSRPWFIFRLELMEEEARHMRLSDSERSRLQYGTRKQVMEWWKERGDWSEEFDEKCMVTSWNWKHETPFPEREDLTPINKMKDSPLDTTDMEFTPSEIDTLETIELPTSEQPKGFWITTESEGCSRPSLPGQYADLSQLPSQSIYYKRPEPQSWQSTFGAPPGDPLQEPERNQSIFGTLLDDPLQEPERNPSELQQEDHQLPTAETTESAPADGLSVRQDEDYQQSRPSLANTSTQCQNRRHETVYQSTILAGGIKQETQGPSCIEGCSGYCSAYDAGGSAQEDVAQGNEAHLSLSSTKDGNADSTQACSQMSGGGE